MLLRRGGFGSNSSVVVIKTYTEIIDCYNDNQSEIIQQPWLGLNTIDTSVLYIQISISRRGFIETFEFHFEMFYH